MSLIYIKVDCTSDREREINNNIITVLFKKAQKKCVPTVESNTIESF